MGFLKASMTTRELQRACSLLTHSLGKVGDFDEGMMIAALADGKMELQTRDENMHIITDIPGNVSGVGAVLLPGKLFIELVRKLSDEVVTLEETERTVVVSSGKTRVNMSKGNPDYFNSNEKDIPNTVTMKQKDLKKMIDRVRFSVGNDPSRQILTGSLLEITPSWAKMVALDGFRMALQMVDMETGLDPEVKMIKTIIPTPVTNVLSALLSPDDETPCTFGISGKSICLRQGETEIYANVFMGEYIDYNRIIPKTFATDVVCDRRLLLSVLERSTVVKDAAMNPVTITIGGRDEGMLYIRTRASISDFSDEIPAEINGDGMEIAFNANFLIAVLRAVNDDEILLRFNNNISPCVIVPKNEEDEKYLYLVLPVRV